MVVISVMLVVVFGSLSRRTLSKVLSSDVFLMCF
jgi:hypothetical protein